MIRKAETTKISLVLENDMLKKLDHESNIQKKKRSELIRDLLQKAIENRYYN